MTCYHPIDAWQNIASGVVFFHEKGRHGETRKLQIACGQCIGCRLERSRQWAVRCMHEAAMHNANCFVTLTYDEEHLPARNNLNYVDFQKFMKRLRKSAGHKVRFYVGGEYGGLNGRPHFHACLFGHDFKDKIYFSRSPTGSKLYRSNELEKLWPYGYSSIGTLTFESAAYIARYCVQKVTGQLAEIHYKRTDNEGDYQLTPEFNRMSLKPGIGATWLNKNMRDVYNHDFIVVNGVKAAAPKYYDKMLKRINPDKMDEFKAERELKAQKYREDNTPERLAAKEQYTKARTKQLLRNKV